MKTIKNQKIFYIIIAITLSLVIGILLGYTVFTGKYFQNWYTAQFGAPNKVLLFSAWLYVTLMNGLIFYLLLTLKDGKRKDCLFLFALQFFLFAISITVFYRMGFYILSALSALLSSISSVFLYKTLNKNNHKKIAVTLALYFLWQLFWLFWISVFCLIAYSLEHGSWID